MNQKAKKIAAIAGIVLLVAMYVVTLILSFIDGEQAAGWFRASVYCTIIVPILLYAYQLIYKVLKKRRDE